MQQTLTRRTLLAAGGSAALFTPSLALASTGGTRSFRVTRGGSDIGFHRVSVRRDGDVVRARTDIEIAVRILGIVAYRYTLNYDEVYRGGLLQSLVSESNDDGDTGYVRVTRVGSALSVDGSKYSGPVDSQAVPTSYWRMAALGATPWISPEDGHLLPVGVAEGGASGLAPSGARVVSASDRDGYDVEIWYNAAGDWVGCTFDARGEVGAYALEPGSDSLVGLTT